MSDSQNSNFAPETAPAVPSGPGLAGPASRQIPWKLFAAFFAALALGFGGALYSLFRFALGSELYSYIPLVPAISLYLAWPHRHRLTPDQPRSWWTPLLLLSGGALLLVLAAAAQSVGWPAVEQDRLFVTTAAFLLFFGAGSAFFLGRHLFGTLAFPAAFLVFLAPLPWVVENGIETFLQHASALAAYLLLKLSAMPVLREGTRFVLPGITIEVAPQCSGIHSTLVLFMTALLADYFFLRKGWTRTVFAAGVVLLGIARNAVRIFTLAELCVRVDPRIIDSSLHHRGGPIFFVLSLAPLFLLLWILRKFDAPKLRSEARLPESNHA